MTTVKAQSKYLKLGDVLTLEQAVTASTSGTGVAIVYNDSKMFTFPTGEGASMFDVSDATSGYMFKLTARTLVDAVQYYRITCFNPNSTLVEAGEAHGIYGGNILSPVSWGAVWASTIESEEWDGRIDFQYGAQWCFESDGAGGYYIKTRAVGSENPYLSGSGNMTNEAGRASYKFYSLVAKDKASLNFNSSGVATIDLTTVDVSGAGLSYNSSTGEVTSTGTSGTIFLSFDNADFKNVNTITVDATTSGDYTDICNTSQVIDAVNGSLNTWYGSRYGMNLAEAGKGYQAKSGQITTIKWNVNATGTMKINSITITGNVINGSAPGWVDLTKSMYTDPSACELNLNKDEGTVVYGKMWGFTLSDYADITNYPQMKITGTAGTTIRIFINSTSAQYYNLDSEGSLVIDFATDNNYKNESTLHLCNIRPLSGNTANISSIQLYNPNYVLNGSGYILSSAQDILDNNSITSIDAMGITAATALTTANPNCLITANDGMVTNAQNVIVGSTCANLVLTDGYLFNPPAGFTATASSYSRDAVGGWGTAVLPFDVDVASANPDIFELTSADEYKVTFTKKESGTIAANTPFVYKKVSGDISFEGSSNAIISTTISGYNVQDVDGTSWKIAQSMEETVIDDVATDDFLKDYDVYGISGNNFVKATKKLTMKPFRAFFLLPKAASGKARYTIEIEDGVTSVAGVDAQQKATELERFNAAGQRIYAPQRGVNLIKMSDGSVKKILVK